MSLGRPRRYKNRHIAQLPIEKEDYDEFAKIARREGKNSNDIIKDFIKNYIKLHGEGNPSFEITKWIKQPDFTALPTLGETPSQKELATLEDNDIVTLASHTRKWVGLLDPRMRSINWRWRWGTKRTDKEITGNEDC